MCLGIILSKSFGEYYSAYTEIAFVLLGLSVFGYYITYDLKRNVYKKNGECFQGHIIGADVIISGRGEWTYYLKISFFDDGEKIKYTEGYEGNPNKKLKNCECNIYKWRGKYIESDFKTLEKKEKPVNLKIPINKRGRSKKKNYV
jgi:hypothetical protein